MNVIAFMMLTIIPVIFLFWTLRFKSFLLFLALAPASLLFVVALELNDDPSITFQEPFSGNTTSTTFTQGDQEHLSETNTQVVILANTPVYHYNVQTGLTAEPIRNVVLSNVAVGEEINTSGSQLVGKKIQCIDIELRAVGSPIGNITVAVFTNLDSTLPLQSFGTIDASSLTSSFEFYTSCTSENAEITAVQTNVFGATYTEGTATDYIEAQRTSSDVFNGGGTRYAEVLFGTTPWVGNSGQDLNMRLYDNIPTTITRTTYSYEPCCTSNSTTTTETVGAGDTVTYELSPDEMLIINAFFTTGIFATFAVILYKGAVIVDKMYRKRNSTLEE